ncbi:MAG: hypothetical protein ONB46_14915 [candidate division KSB1 bacterium]|nr:hypothetical protein [candidate division KSB1 bacterium]MDZ7367018.1 hypothetical protein [candidate division KSB1 bacterium]MDZ7406718.1 hypothetical protein [candidate division KSB1 bacterium]
MEKFLNKHQDTIKGTLSTFDRLIFKGHLTACFPNVDKPQPKRVLTEWNSHGKNFHEFISVRVHFREPKVFAFSAKNSVVID